MHVKYSPRLTELVVAARVRLAGHPDAWARCRLLQPRHVNPRPSRARRSAGRTAAMADTIVNPRIEEYLRRLYDDGDPVRLRDGGAGAAAALPDRGAAGRAATWSVLTRAIGARRVFELGSGLRLLGAALRARGGRRAARSTARSCPRRTCGWPRASCARAGVWDRVTLPPRGGHGRAARAWAAPGTSSTTTSTRTAIRPRWTWPTRTCARAASSSPTTCSGPAACSTGEDDGTRGHARRARVHAPAAGATRAS